MNPREIARSFVAGCIVYAVMAACSGDPAPARRVAAGLDSGGPEAGPDAALATGGTGGRPASKDASAGDSGGLLDAAVDYVRDAARDALGDRFVAPVPDAQAAVPLVITSSCIPSSTISGVAFATASFPTRTVQDLSAVRVVLNYPSTAIGVTVVPPDGTYGDAMGTSTMYLKTGWVAVQCNPNYTNSVTFILP